MPKNFIGGKEEGGGEERGKEGRAGGLSGAEGGESERGDWVVVCPKDSHPSSPLDSGPPF